MHSKDINFIFLSITQLYYCKIVLLFSSQNRLTYLAFQNVTFSVPMCLFCAFISKRIWDHFVLKAIYRQVFELMHSYTFQKIHYFLLSFLILCKLIFYYIGNMMAKHSMCKFPIHIIS